MCFAIPSTPGSDRAAVRGARCRWDLPKSTSARRERLPLRRSGGGDAAGAAPGGPCDDGGQRPGDDRGFRGTGVAERQVSAGDFDQESGVGAAGVPGAGDVLEQPFQHRGGMSLKVAPLSRSTACSQTSLVRIHTVSSAGTMRPWAVLTLWFQASAGRPRHSTFRCTAEWSKRCRSAIRDSVAPKSISWFRASGEEYIGISTPVAAHSISRAMACAL